MFCTGYCSRKGARRAEERKKKKTKMTKLDFHRFQVRHFSSNFEQTYGYCEDGAMPESRSKCPWTFKNHHEAKYQHVDANTLYVAAILFSYSSLHRETLPCLPNRRSSPKIFTFDFTCTQQQCQAILRKPRSSSPPIL